jgi:eukaryotic-like serine/threonine-protein kinase
MAAVGRPKPTSPDLGSAPTWVRDSDGNPLELEPHPIGRDGKGAVYRVRLSDYAVKLMTDEQVAGPGECVDVEERLAARIARVRWLPLEGLPIFMPLTTLAAPHVGYVMRFQDGMVPIADLCEPPEDQVESWYLTGGGLRRRLRLLARCAGILATLHGRGLVYGDVAPANVLISAAARKDEVWLIDPDNITIESSASQRPVATRLYRAPEIVRQQSGVTQFSDAYSFAILAYQTLRADHPLIGDLTADPARQNDAEQGLLPWTGHATDERNRSPYGIPAEAALTSRLTKLFEQAFEDGLREPFRRPRMLAWLAALGAAADRTVSCPNRGCRHMYYAFAARCPFCEASRPDTIMVGIHDEIPGAFGVRDDEPVTSGPVDWIVLQDGEPFVVTTRHSRLVASADEKQVLRLRWRAGGSLELSNIGDGPVRWMPSGGGPGRTLRPGASTSGRADGGWRVHFGDDQRIHRVLTFGRAGEPAPQADPALSPTALRGA